ncbi:hypothetical protein BV25DRAFT_1469277 [Artomyces pyxidatus]|uniref:Uncharacterized protein n=1 Tax=Artomyces pyxidatus TaxID=48021 RepID=A0ACB8SKX0_9AGAM|nr:hypothetical protein BV25DRAFT_1469277 [Artomyces pyxidatus]
MTSATRHLAGSERWLGDALLHRRRSSSGSDARWYMMQGRDILAGGRGAVSGACFAYVLSAYTHVPYPIRQYVKAGEAVCRNPPHPSHFSAQSASHTPLYLFCRIHTQVDARRSPHVSGGWVCDEGEDRDAYTRCTQVVTDTYIIFQVERSENCHMIVSSEGEGTLCVFCVSCLQRTTHIDGSVPCA